MKHPTITCHHCEGSGRIELPDSLLNVLFTFRGLSGVTRNAGDVHAMLSRYESTGIRSVNNRLERLRKAGFLTRARHGKFWRYSLVSKTK